MINRRQFCFSLASLSTLLVGPDLAPPPHLSPVPAPIPLDILPAAQREQIAVLERYLQQQPTLFAWYVHNELRHLYHTISAEHSFYHADIILEHVTMDNYMLNILSEWNLDRDAGVAIAALWAKVQRYPQFAFLGAASLIQIGDLFGRQERPAASRRVYQVVADGRSAPHVNVPALDVYRQLARYRLAMLDAAAVHPGGALID
jgi:hypothetical protein